MNREEALNDWLPIIRQMVKGTEVYEEALDMAIKSLKQEPCSNCIEFKRYAKEMGFEIEQEPCGDAVSRRAVISTIYDNKSDFKNDFAQGFFADRIRGLPPVTIQPKVGRWLIKRVRDYDHAICSVCGDDSFLYPEWDALELYRYCPNCGAKMEV